MPVANAASWALGQLPKPLACLLEALRSVDRLCLVRDGIFRELIS